MLGLPSCDCITFCVYYHVTALPFLCTVMWLCIIYVRLLLWYCFHQSSWSFAGPAGWAFPSCLLWHEGAGGMTDLAGCDQVYCQKAEFLSTGRRSSISGQGHCCTQRLLPDTVRLEFHLSVYKRCRGQLLDVFLRSLLPPFCRQLSTCRSNLCCSSSWIEWMFSQWSATAKWLFAYWWLPFCVKLNTETDLWSQVLPDVGTRRNTCRWCTVQTNTAGYLQSLPSEAVLLGNWCGVSEHNCYVERVCSWPLCITIMESYNIYRYIHDYDDAPIVTGVSTMGGGTHVSVWKITIDPTSYLHFSFL